MENREKLVAVQYAQILGRDEWSDTEKESLIDQPSPELVIPGVVKDLLDESAPVEKAPLFKTQERTPMKFLHVAGDTSLVAGTEEMFWTILGHGPLCCYYDKVRHVVGLRIGADADSVALIEITDSAGYKCIASTIRGFWLLWKNEHVSPNGQEMAGFPSGQELAESADFLLTHN